VCPLRGQSLEARLAAQCGVRHAKAPSLREHDRLITKAAQASLEPLGCVQDDTSRTWIDDHGWWVAVIEFQPSSWSKGSYLNVGACWLWRETDHFAFDLGYRVQGFRGFEDPTQFAKASEELAGRAAREVLKLRARIAGVRPIAWRLRLKWMPTLWDHYHAAVANGLVGKWAVARRRLRAISHSQADAEWVVALKGRALRLEPLLGEPDRFRQEVQAMIVRSRELLGLPALTTSSQFDA